MAAEGRSADPAYSGAVTTGSGSDPAPPDASIGALGLLDAVTAEIEAHLAAGGWDQPPALFALVPTTLVAADPSGAAMLDLPAGAVIPPDSLTPVAQDALPDQPLDEALAAIEWPPAVAGCALSQEIVILPPGAEDELSDSDAVSEAATHPDRREARLVVSVLRDGAMATVLRIRAMSPGERDDIAFGADLAPNLTAALRATLD